MIHVLPLPILILVPMLRYDTPSAGFDGFNDTKPPF